MLEWWFCTISHSFPLAFWFVSRTLCRSMYISLNLSCSVCLIQSISLSLSLNLHSVCRTQSAGCTLATHTVLPLIGVWLAVAVLDWAGCVQRRHMPQVESCWREPTTNPRPREQTCDHLRPFTYCCSTNWQRTADIWKQLATKWFSYSGLSYGDLPSAHCTTLHWRQQRRSNTFTHRLHSAPYYIILYST